MSKTKVFLDFVNKKGVLKHVYFYMEEDEYKRLIDQSVNEDYKHHVLIDAYNQTRKDSYQLHHHKTVRLIEDAVADDASDNNLER